MLPMLMSTPVIYKKDFTLQSIGFLAGGAMLVFFAQNVIFKAIGTVLFIVGLFGLYPFAQPDVPSPHPSDKFGEIKNKWKVLQQVGKAI